MIKTFVKPRTKEYDVTIFQTPKYRETRGYREVYRTHIGGANHEECLSNVFKQFNVLDRMPFDFQGRFLSTGDILYIDEGRRGQYYYQLKSGGWALVNRIMVR